MFKGEAAVGEGQLKELGVRLDAQLVKEGN